MAVGSVALVLDFLNAAVCAGSRLYYDDPT